MSTLVNYALARCIIPAARYLQVASSIEAGILPADESLVLKFDNGYLPGQDWVKAVRRFYSELDYNIQRLVYARDLPEEINVDDVMPWKNANECGDCTIWMRRVINEMMALRQQNGSDDLGDHEFRLIMRAVCMEFSH